MTASLLHFIYFQEAVNGKVIHIRVLTVIHIRVLTGSTFRLTTTIIIITIIIIIIIIKVIIIFLNIQSDIPQNVYKYSMNG